MFPFSAPAMVYGQPARRRVRCWDEREAAQKRRYDARIRALIQASDEPMKVLARRIGVETIARWQRHDSVEDRSHTATACGPRFTPSR
jgi:hypothetical protein